MSDAEPGNSIQSCVDKMLASYDLYDLYVDAVSAFEALCTGGGPLAPHVAHFERFPTLHLDDERTVRPDFAILFNDGTGVVGELARFALHESSVDKLCKQIGQYDGIARVPGPGRSQQPVQHADVILIVPMELTNDAVDRILNDRMNNAAHPYKPTSPPVIVGMIRDGSRLLFLQNRATSAGAVTHAELARLLTRQFKAPAAFYEDTKVTRPFMNDPIDDLYLAARLWAVLPELADADAQEVETSINEICALMTTQYEKGAKKDIKRALDLLRDAGLIKIKNETITQHRTRLSKGDRQSVHRMIARRACEARTPPPPPATSTPTAPPAQPALF